MKFFQIITYFFIALFISLSSCSIFKTDPYQCKTCHGKGYIHQSCNACQSTGKKYCNFCQSGKQTCTLCHGSGYTKICGQCNSGYTICRFCDKGYVVHKKIDGTTVKNVCRTCGGTYRKLCTTCKGNYKRMCSLCKGFGSKTCNWCHGNFVKTCNICFGRTYLCTDCNGSGRIDTTMFSLQ